jgi:sec-independent protein translocase protein TatB
VFGIGMQEMVIIGLIVLVIFGPKNLPNMARDVGRFVSDARRSVDEFKEDLVSEKEDGQELPQNRTPEASQEPEVNMGSEEDAAIESSAQRTEQP